MKHELSDRLVIIGTSHIAEQSVREIKRVFKNFEPDVVGIELDQQRLYALLHPEIKRTYPLSLIKQVGIVGYSFVLIGGWLQRRIAGVVNMDPGVDMKTAHDLARKEKKGVLLVDQPMNITLKNLSRWKKKERWLLFWDLITSPFRKGMKMTISLKNVPADKMLDKLMIYFKGRYPSLHKVLVADRDRFMTQSIKSFQKRFPDKRLLVVVGAGHVEGMMKRFEMEGSSKSEIDRPR